jgi:hypothetical protein
MNPKRNASGSLWSMLVLVLSAVALPSCATSGADNGLDGGHTDGKAAGDGACGAIDEPCCAPPSVCNVGAFCNPDHLCKNQHPKDIGHSCSMPSQCSSDICGYTQGLGDGGVAIPDGSPPPDCPSTGCTVGCNTPSDCFPGWKCSSLSVDDGICTCSCAEEACDGLDNNCNGVIDDEPAASKWCTAQMEGIPQKCVKGGCACIHTCDDTCVDIDTDPANCGKCNKTCKATVEKCDKGECVCAFTVCHGDCVDTMASDNANCGGCDKTCAYECTKGTCGPLTIATPDLTGVGPIVTDATNVYWLGSVEGTGYEVQYCPLSGCPGGKPTTLATWTSSSSFFFGSVDLGQLAVGKSTVYFGDDLSDILVCPVAGCGGSPTVYSSSADTETSYLAADSTNLYWANESAETVFDCPLGATCTSPNLIQETSSLGLEAQGMTVAGSSLYWGGFDDGSSKFTVFSAPTTGGAVSTLCSGTLGGFGEGIGQLLVAGAFVYFTDGSTSVFSCAVSATGATAKTYVLDTNGPMGLASDGTDLYWTDPGSGGSSSGSSSGPKMGGGSIMKCALGATCAKATTVLTDLVLPDGIAVSATQIYWTSTSFSAPAVQYFHK